MGFLKELGSFVGEVTGGIVGGTVNVIGDITGSEFIGEIGDGIKKASSFAGDKLGEAASGTWDIAAGIITQDSTQFEEGLQDIGKACGDTAVAAGHAVCNIVDNGANVVGGIVDGDTDRIKDGTKGLVKVGVVGVLSLGIIDLVDGADGGIHGADMTSTQVADTLQSTDLSAGQTDVHLVDNPNDHHVSPHWRTLPSGETIWVDGDGDTSINTFDGWTQSNPDYRVKA